MIIGSLLLELFIPTSHSLKDKRSVVKSILQRLRNEFNVSTAEVDQQDRWQVAVLGVACVSSDRQYAHQQLQAVVEWVYNNRPDLEVSRADIEIL
ncbi:MAG TPA: DUF503 domain-containing protein [Herpetosiphonaceae bacterium]